MCLEQILDINEEENSMKLLKAAPVRVKIMDEVQEKVTKLKSEGVKPKLVVILVGEDAASQVYVGRKHKACEKLGIISEQIILPTSTTEEKLLSEVDRLNEDDSVHGILVQFPLPSHMSKKRVASRISFKKDCDGFHPMSQGIGLTGMEVFAPMPCTPLGIIKLLDGYDIDLNGKSVAVIGRSNIVGKPMMYMTLNKNATVSIMHRRTPDSLKKHILSEADVIIAAAGVRNLFRPEDVKKGVVIIDVGIHRLDDGSLGGDVITEDFEGIASAITPVPGGVGPMTITMLMYNLVHLAEQYK